MGSEVLIMKLWYMNGAGNDFAVADARGVSFEMSDMAVKSCQMLGADGFMALDNSDIADFKLHFYNSDGSRAQMCGNGARCICRFAYDNGIVGERMSIETDAGTVFGERISEDRYKVRLNLPTDIKLDVKSGVDYVRVGVPHVVIALDTLDFDERDRLSELAREYRKRFDANVNFYSRISESEVRNLTYERGVEDFTLACGTGSAAVAAVLWSKGELSGNSLTVKNKGGELTVTIESRENEITALYLEGSAAVDKIVEY